MGSTALVTGGNRGIGREVCRQLAAQGCRVLLGCRRISDGERAAAGLGATVEPVVLDVGSNASVAACAGQHPRVDILVNNAAVLAEGAALEVAWTDVMEATNVNLLGAWRCARAWMPGMIQRGHGRVVNVSSGWGAFSDGLDGPAAYGVSKAALNALTVSLSKGVPPDVKVNAVCPGWVRTRMGGVGAERSVEEGADGIVWLCCIGVDGPHGTFTRDREVLAW